MLKTGFTDVESVLFEQLDRLNDLTPEEINTDLGKAELKRSQIRAMEIMDRAGIAMEEPKMLRLE